MNCGHSKEKNRNSGINRAVWSIFNIIADVITVCFFLLLLLLNIEVTRRENQYNEPSSNQIIGTYRYL